MSFYRQIKTFYTIAYSTFFFILWNTVIPILIGKAVSSRLYINIIVISLFLQFLLWKIGNKKLAIIVAIILGEILFFLLKIPEGLILNSIFLIFIIIFTSKSEAEDIEYETYKQQSKKALIILVAAGLLSTAARTSSDLSSIKFYSIFLAADIILLRETRRYYYRINSSNSYIANLILGGSIMLLSLDVVFNKILFVISYIAKTASKVLGLFLSFILTMVAIILEKPFTALINFIKSRLNVSSDVIDNMLEAQKNRNKLPDNQLKYASSQGLPIWVDNIMKLALLILILYVVYRLIFKQSSKMPAENILFEEREKIIFKKEKKPNFIKRIIKELFKPNDLKSQVLNVYQKFQQKTYEKDIFKKHMTAKQLENVTKTSIDSKANLNSITEIYNKAKFSDEQVSESEVKVINEEFSKFKNDL